MVALAKQGDSQAKDELISKNDRLNYHIARKFSNTGLEVEDLASISRIGMMKAYNTFDVEKKIKFSTYATRCMTNEILMFLRRNKKHSQTTSIDTPLNVDLDGNELTLMDVVEDVNAPDLDESFNRADLWELATEFQETINEKEKVVFSKRIMGGAKQNDLAKEMGISQPYIARLTQKVARKFREFAVRREFIDRTEIPKTVKATPNTTNRTVAKLKEEKGMARGKEIEEKGKLLYGFGRYPDLTVADWSRIFDLGYQTVYQWKKKHDEGKCDGMELDPTNVDKRVQAYLEDEASRKIKESLEQETKFFENKGALPKPDTFPINPCAHEFDMPQHPPCNLGNINFEDYVEEDKVVKGDVNISMDMESSIDEIIKALQALKVIVGDSKIKINIDN